MNAPARARRRATYDDLLKAPEPCLAQIVDGELVVLPRPGSRHVRASSRLGYLLGGPFDLGSNGPGGWWIVDEPELHLGEDVLVPDLAGWRRERMPEWPDVPYFQVVPDWVCEVLSPSTERLDRIRKLRIYGREGVGHAWLVHPEWRTLEVYRFTGGGAEVVATYDAAQGVRAEPFDAVEIDLALLFAGPPPAPA